MARIQAVRPKPSTKKNAPKPPKAPKQRDPLLTAAGKRYTYAGWVRAYNAARAKADVDKPGGREAWYLVDRLRGAYLDYWEQYKRQHKIQANIHTARPKPAKSQTPVQRRSRGRLLSSTKPDYPRLSVRARKYHDMAGFVITGKDVIGRNVSIFARTKTEAQRIKRDLLAGQNVKFDNESSQTIVHSF